VRHNADDLGEQGCLLKDHAHRLIVWIPPSALPYTADEPEPLTPKQQKQLADWEAELINEEAA
jgi:hypothetical protein